MLYKREGPRRSGRLRLSILMMMRKRKKKRIMAMRHALLTLGLMLMLGLAPKSKGIKTKKGLKCSHLEIKPWIHKGITQQIIR